MAAAAPASADVALAEQHREPRSTVTIRFGPRGQMLPKVTIVTGEPDELLDALVLKACAAADYELHRRSFEIAGGLAGRHGE